LLDNNSKTVERPHMADPIKVYPAKPAKVYFYGTCLVDMFYPDAGIAGVELLEREGIEVLFPQDQTCCGPSWCPQALAAG
jgi:Fe-S oxidoreductase